LPVQGAAVPKACGELYDLEADPHEFANLYNEAGRAGVCADMTLALLTHLATAWARFPAHPEGRGWVDED
jgi:hypothetical protein